MKAKFQFSRWDLALLITNAVVLGGSVVLLAFGRASGPFILLTIGAFLLLVGKVGRSYYRARGSELSLPAA